MHSSDLSVLYFFNHTLASPALDTVMDGLTNVKYWYAVYVLGGIYTIYRYKMEGVRLVVAALLLVAFTDSLSHYVLKPLFARPRPCAMLPNGEHVVSWIRLPIGPKFDPSFPSNHALNNFAIATLFALVYPWKKIGRWLMSIALIISIGRVYEGVHYPSDVVGGALLGLLFGAAAGVLYDFLVERFTGAPVAAFDAVELTDEDIGSVDLAASSSTATSQHTQKPQPETKRLWLTEEPASEE